MFCSYLSQMNSVTFLQKLQKVYDTNKIFRDAYNISCIDACENEECETMFTL